MSPADMVCVKPLKAHIRQLTEHSKSLYNRGMQKDPLSLKRANIRRALCSDPELTTAKSRYEVYWHRQACHAQSWETYCTLQRAVGNPVPRLKSCKTTSWSSHCECFDKVRLHQQLKTWMPIGLQYCGHCNKFTKRKKSHKGRCESACGVSFGRAHVLTGCKGYHGRPKPVNRQNPLWTHKRGRGAFGYDLWKKWVNNAAMNKYEARLRTLAQDRGGERYNLRQLKPKDIDTRMQRSVYQ